MFKKDRDYTSRMALAKRSSSAMFWRSPLNVDFAPIKRLRRFHGMQQSQTVVEAMLKILTQCCIVLSVSWKLKPWGSQPAVSQLLLTTCLLQLVAKVLAKI